MSLYTFATDNLTTFADLRRRPAIDKGQLQRTVALLTVFVIAFALAAHRRDIDTSVRPESPLASRVVVQ